MRKAKTFKLYTLSLVMRKHLERHAFPLTALFIITLLFIGYEYFQTKTLTITLQQEISRLENSLEEKVTVLRNDLSLAQKDITSLGTSLEEKETKIKALGTELQEVKVESEKQIGALEDKVTQLKLQNQDFSEVIEKSIPAVVSIRTNAGSGSGFLVRENGYIVTNNHVINGATAATIVTSDEAQHRVFLIGKDSRADIAVLKIESSGYSWLNFGDSDRINIGEKVIAIGNPGGLDFTVTQGIVSAVDRVDAQGNSYVQIDVPINPGNSGGPLLDVAGEVIGVTTKKLADFEGLGFALESNQVREIVDGMIESYEESLEKK